MESQDLNPQMFTETTPNEADQGSGMKRQIPRLVFGIASIWFLAFLAIGSIEARIWRFGRLNFEDRTVREVWAYFGEHLPAMPGQSVFSALYWISIAVMVLATVIGLWLFLGTEDEDPAADAGPNAPETAVSTHA